MDLSELNPEGLSSAEFLEKNRFVVLPQLLDSNTVQFLSSYYAAMEPDESGKYGRDRTSLHAYGDACSDICMYLLREKLEEQAGFKLVPAFSFVRHYKKGDVLGRHNDRPSNEVSCTITITRDVDWPIGFSNKFGGKEYILGTDPGDAVLYWGNELEHWRKKYTGESQVQLIAGFIVEGGKFDIPGYRFDGRDEPQYAPGYSKPEAITQVGKRKAFVLWRNLRHRLGLPEKHRR